MNLTIVSIPSDEDVDCRWKREWVRNNNKWPTDHRRRGRAAAMYFVPSTINKQSIKKYKLFFNSYYATEYGERKICLKKTVSLLQLLCNRILYVVIAITIIIPPHLTSLYHQNEMIFWKKNIKKWFISKLITDSRRNRRCVNLLWILQKRMRLDTRVNWKWKLGGWSVGQLSHSIANLVCVFVYFWQLSRYFSKKNYINIFLTTLGIVSRER